MLINTLRRQTPHIKPGNFTNFTRTMSSNPAQNNNPYKSPEDPSLIGGHAQYVKGYVEETVGNVTGSKEWVDSGKKDTQEGIETMKVSFVKS